MEEEFHIEINCLRPSDLGDAVQLALNEGWNQTEDDWKRVQRLCPLGCFAALSESRLVGTVTTIPYRQELAWLGMMLVKPEYRGRGVGKRLILAALNFCREAGIKTVKLDATPVGKPLYTSCGFSTEAIVERWEAVAPSVCGTNESVVPLDSGMRQQLYDFDYEALGVDRRPLLDALIAEHCREAAVVLQSSSRSLKGYGLARRGSRAYYVGPILAADPLVAHSLLDAMLVHLRGRRIYLDLLIKPETDWSALADRGFVKQRSLTRMFLGHPSSSATTNRVFAIAGPELG